MKNEGDDLDHYLRAVYGGLIHVVRDGEVRSGRSHSSRWQAGLNVGAIYRGWESWVNQRRSCLMMMSKGSLWTKRRSGRRRLLSPIKHVRLTFIVVIEGSPAVLMCSPFLYISISIGWECLVGVVRWSMIVLAGKSRFSRALQRMKKIKVSKFFIHQNLRTNH